MNDLLEATDGRRVWLDGLASLRRHKWIVVLVFLSVVVTAYAALQMLSEKYETQAALLVKLGRENLEVPTTVQRGSLLTTGVRKEELNSIVQMMQARSLVEATIDEIGIEAFRFQPERPRGLLPTIKFHIKQTARFAKRQYESFLIAVNLQKALSEREKIVLGISDAITVEPQKDSDVLLVRVRLPDPVLCVRVAEVLLEKFLAKHLEVRRSDHASDFLDSQVAENKRQLQNLDNLKSVLRDNWNLSSPPEQRSLLLKQLSEISDAINSNLGERAMIESQLRVLKSGFDALPTNLQSSEVTTPNPSVQSLKDRVTTLKLDRARLASNYTAKSPALEKLDKEIAALETLLLGEAPTLIGSTTSEINPLRQNLKQQIQELEAKIAGFNAKIQELRTPAAYLQKRIAYLDAGETKLDTIERERRIAEGNYLDYTKRMEEAHVAEELDARRISNITIIAAPSLPLEPVYPRKLLIMGVALAVGLMLGVALALVFDFMSDKVRSAGDVEAMDGIEFLGSFRLS